MIFGIKEKSIILTHTMYLSHVCVLIFCFDLVFTCVLSSSLPPVVSWIIPLVPVFLSPEFSPVQLPVIVWCFVCWDYPELFPSIRVDYYIKRLCFWIILISASSLEFRDSIFGYCYNIPQRLKTGFVVQGHILLCNNYYNNNNNYCNNNKT